MATLTAAAPMAPLVSNLLAGGVLLHSGPATTGSAYTIALQQGQETDISTEVEA
ncbi:hypothetical protein RUND412_009912, partial [Rhizina undulata]